MDAVKLSRAMERVELMAAMRRAESTETDAEAVASMMRRMARAEREAAKARDGESAAREMMHAAEAALRDALYRLAQLDGAGAARDAAIAAAGLATLRQRGAEEARDAAERGRAVLDAQLERTEAELERVRTEAASLADALRRAEADRDAAVAGERSADRRVQGLLLQVADLQRAIVAARRVATAAPQPEASAAELRLWLRSDRVGRQWAALTEARLAAEDCAPLRVALHRVNGAPIGAKRAAAVETLRQVAAAVLGVPHAAA